MPLVPERAYRMIASVGRADRVPDTAVAVRAYVNGRLALDSLAIHRGPLGLELVSKAATAVERTL